MNNIETIFKFLILFGVGSVFLTAGIFKWKIPSIYWFLKKTEYGEIINTAVMIIAGICFWGSAFDILF